MVGMSKQMYGVKWLACIATLGVIVAYGLMADQGSRQEPAWSERAVALDSGVIPYSVLLDESCGVVIATAAEVRRAYGISIHDDRILWNLATPDPAVFGAVVGPGRAVFSLAGSGQVLRVEYDHQRATSTAATIAPNAQLGPVAWVPSRSHLAVGSFRPPELLLLRLAEFQLDATIPLNGVPISLALNPVTGALAVGYGSAGGGGHDLCVVDLRGRRVAAAFELPGHDIRALAAYGDGFLAAANEPLHDPEAQFRNGLYFVSRAAQKRRLNLDVRRAFGMTVVGDLCLLTALTPQGYGLLVYDVKSERLLLRVPLQDEPWGTIVVHREDDHLVAYVPDVNARAIRVFRLSGLPLSPSTDQAADRPDG